MNRISLPLFFLMVLIASGPVGTAAQLAGTAPLQPAAGEARSREMVAGIDRFLMRAIDDARISRERLWKRDLSSAQAYRRSIEPNRQRLRRILGVVREDQRVTFTALELDCTTEFDAKLAESSDYTLYAARWPVFRDVHGEGLLLRPKGQVKANVIVLPDADMTPRMLTGLTEGVASVSRAPLRLVQLGCEVVVPLLVNRGSECSGSPELNIWTDLTHREWLYRMTFELGRHIIGYETQKIFALVDWMERKDKTGNTPIVVAGYGEGGLLALYAAAVDTRIQSVLVSGYLRNRDQMWREPLYRNVFGLLREFGDAEIASLILPRQLVVEYSLYPRTEQNKKAPPGARAVAAPGQLSHPEVREVIEEARRARLLAGGSCDDSLVFVTGADDTACPFFSAAAINALLMGLDIGPIDVEVSAAPVLTEAPLDNAARRQRRQIREIQHDAQRLLCVCEKERQTRFWEKLPLCSAREFESATKEFRREFVNEVIGAFSNPLLPLRAHSRMLTENEAFAVYDITIDVWPDVFAWGYLSVPKDIRNGERRPAVVCQHGLEGLPSSCANEDKNSRDYKAYKGMASYLARQGFVTFAPHNPYRGGDKFRMLQRKLNPLGKTLFSVINSQHGRILDWLATQPYIDATRIAFYGLSYGGKSAMRIPAAREGYCLSICSGDFNDWIRKVISDDFRYSYLFTGEWEIGEWNLGRTFNYAEMAALIAPRPFMVERGRDDLCGLDEWIAWEYAKVDRLYDRLDLGDKTEIEYFNGPHTINGKGTYEFLYKHLRWRRKGE